VAKALEYSEYRHFISVVSKANETCKHSGYNVNDHIEEILDMIEIEKGGMREVENVKHRAMHVI
jgi:DNA-damage-inducible protein D